MLKHLATILVLLSICLPGEAWAIKPMEGYEEEVMERFKYLDLGSEAHEDLPAMPLIPLSLQMHLGVLWQIQQGTGLLLISLFLGYLLVKRRAKPAINN